MRGTMRERRPEGEGRCSPYCNATGSIVNNDYYEVLTKVIVKQIMIVDTYRTMRNDSWNIDCKILDDVSTFYIVLEEEGPAGCGRSFKVSLAILCPGV
jgi:hypothetical protein